MGSNRRRPFRAGYGDREPGGQHHSERNRRCFQKGGRESWVSSNLNKGHYDYYYWILTILSVGNLVYFIFCSRAYKCCEEERVWDEDVVEDKAGASMPKETAMIDMHSSRDASSTYFSA
ncbi:UNVERIFIED_CONTAM: protein NRT1/ PTR FAMILY 1.2 [Sesamum radiatum]|uniref:Protein NRT1/ PTR FAMILY 1.2 n=1 Tax=Sesamum radiatum TaxID=300843 RepID=A0AAW2KNN7_SESRA